MAIKRLSWLILCAILLIGWKSLELGEAFLPKHFPKPVYRFEGNPLTREKIQLGRALFYDNLLSSNRTISCASCHSVYNAFAHTDHATSHGINDRIGKRNAPALMNLAWQPMFMWDGAINHLDVQSLAPISHPDEMGSSLADVARALRTSALYPTLFQKAFGDTAITGERILKSLSQFMLTLVSANSRYDRMKKKEIAFTDQENRGYALFREHCNSCHTEPLFSNYSFVNNGLPVDPAKQDAGRGGITRLAADSFAFKVPSLRNVAYSYPYMHDGRYYSLGEVLNHYTGNRRNSGQVAPQTAQAMPISSNDKVDLIAFLLSLSDSSFVFNRDLAFPREILLPHQPSTP